MTWEEFQELQEFLNQWDQEKEEEFFDSIEDQNLGLPQWPDLPYNSIPREWKS